MAMRASRLLEDAALQLPDLATFKRRIIESDTIYIPWRCLVLARIAIRGRSSNRGHRCMPTPADAYFSHSHDLSLTAPSHE